MIIIKIEHGDVTDWITAIASIMFNMELGKHIFDLQGNIVDGKSNYHVLSKNGISYTIRGIAGNLIILPTNSIILNNIESELHDLDCKYEEKYGSKYQYSQESSDYAVKMIKCHGRTLLKTRIPMVDVFVWRTLDIPNSIKVLKNTAERLNRNMYEFNNIMNYNTLIIDMANIFKMDDKVVFMDRPLSISDYNMGNIVVCNETICIFEKTGVLYEIYKSFDVADSYHGINFQPIFSPIFEEKWSNIKPRRCARPEGFTTRDTLASQIIEILYEPYNYEIAELEEVKNVESGRPCTSSDICHVCFMYLHDYIYVLESETTHVCVCPLCFDQYIVGYIQTDITILKVQCPRTIYDIIDMPECKMTPPAKLLMKELINMKINYKKDVIETENFVGYTDLYPVLIKRIIPPKNKKVFSYRLH